MKNKYDTKFFEVFDKIEIEIGRKTSWGEVADCFYPGQTARIHPQIGDLEILLRAFLVKKIEQDKISKSNFLTWFEKFRSGK